MLWYMSSFSSLITEFYLIVGIHHILPDYSFWQWMLWLLIYFSFLYICGELMYKPWEPNFLLLYLEPKMELVDHIVIPFLIKFCGIAFKIGGTILICTCEWHWILCIEKYYKRQVHQESTWLMWVQMI